MLVVPGEPTYLVQPWLLRGRARWVTRLIGHRICDNLTPREATDHGPRSAEDAKPKDRLRFKPWGRAM
jgi:hypothetical protein